MNFDRPQHQARDLPGGMHLRAMRSSDLAEMVEFVHRVFGAVLKEPGIDYMAGIWAAELLHGDHPTTRPEDGAVIVDTATNRIVASSFLISQQWKYDDISFPVGRPELIASDPAYRGRGLIREIMRSIHAHSEALGHQLQSLTGIPYYYRQYGYEPALISEENRCGLLAAIPGQDFRQAEPIRFRPAQANDLPFFTQMYERAAARTLISAVRDESIWRHELEARDPGGDYWHELHIVEDRAGIAIGGCAYVAELRDDSIVCTMAELIDDGRWSDVAIPFLHWLRTQGETMALGSGVECTGVGFDWTPDHPLILAAPAVFPDVSDRFVFYVRIGNLARFIALIAPVLEAQLAESEFAGYSGRITLSFYPAGLMVAFQDGRFVEAIDLPDAPHRTADMCIPGRTFLQLLLGSRSIEDLEFAFPFELRTNNPAARRVLTALFPKRSSAVWPIA